MRHWRAFGVSLALTLVVGFAWSQQSSVGGSPARLRVQSLGVNTAAPATAGHVTATQFNGSGSGLTTLNASNLSSGTVSDARLSSNVVLENQGNTFTQGSQAFASSTTAEQIRLGGSGALASAYMAWYDTAGVRRGYLQSDQVTAAFNVDSEAYDYRLYTANVLRMQITNGGGISFPNNGNFILPAGATLNGTAFRSGAHARNVGGRVTVSGSCSVTSDFGIASCTYNGTGNVTVTFDESFAADPGCTATTDQIGTAAYISSISVSSVTVRQFNTSTVTNLDRTFYVTCIGS